MQKNIIIIMSILCLWSILVSGRIKGEEAVSDNNIEAVAVTIEVKYASEEDVDLDNWTPQRKDAMLLISVKANDKERLSADMIKLFKVLQREEMDCSQMLYTEIDEQGVWMKATAFLKDEGEYIVRVVKEDYVIENKGFCVQFKDYDAKEKEIQEEK